MFARVTAATIALALALPMALASPTPLEARTEPSCSTGPIQCCQTTNSTVGLTCSPLTAVGVSGTSCSGQTVCCNNNNFTGVIAIGCTPINISA
ncbi:fungal hydrophobin [Ephemerocybe angulata]|uniref:Hydrophobin n=1 Tax=Ephemerocybe angulata TaxID=980116 RepID=A0A8H6MC74_9AGAR|nr:fungal hydrophobin [Tulosesus angulatus]